MVGGLYRYLLRRRGVFVEKGRGLVLDVMVMRYLVPLVHLVRGVIRGAQRHAGRAAISCSGERPELPESAYVCQAGSPLRIAGDGFL